MCRDAGFSSRRSTAICENCKREFPIIGAGYLEMMDDAEAAGEGGLDNSAVFLAVERMAKD